MKCMYCQGVMERKVAPYHVDRRNYHLQLDSIPAWICAQCGEAYFEEKEVKAIQRVIQEIDAHVPLLAESA